MSQEAVNLATVLIGFVSAVAAVAAAFAAYKSASTAQNAARDAANAHRRGFIGSLMTFAGSGIGEMERIDALIKQMKRGISDLNHMGGSPNPNTITNAEKKRSDLLPLYEEAIVIIRDPLQLGATSDDDLMQGLAKMQGFVSQARTFKENLERETSLIEDDVKYMREKRR